MPDELALKKAAEYVGFKKDLLKKFMTDSEEIAYFRKGNRYYVNLHELQRWKSLQEHRKILLNADDYKECLEFAIRINYEGHTAADFGTARQRGKLQAISNWTQGTLAEISLKKFLQDQFNVIITLDFNVHEGIITGQDITEVQRGKVINPPRIRVSIKSGKTTSRFLIVPEKEVTLPQRRSQYYVFVRVDFPDDHLLRIVKDHPSLENVSDLIPDFGDITTYICGYIPVDGLERVTEIPGQRFDSPRCVKKVGGLRNEDEDWTEFTRVL